jgi:hypothetical protein
MKQNSKQFKDIKEWISKNYTTPSFTYLEAALVPCRICNSRVCVEVIFSVERLTVTIQCLMTKKDCILGKIGFKHETTNYYALEITGKEDNLHIHIRHFMDHIIFSWNQQQS